MCTPTEVVSVAPRYDLTITAILTNLKLLHMTNNRGVGACINVIEFSIYRDYSCRWLTVNKLEIHRRATKTMRMEVSHEQKDHP